MSEKDTSTKSSTTAYQVTKSKEQIDPMEWAEIYGHENFHELKNELK